MPNITPDDGNQDQYDHMPDVCPQCHHALHPKLLQATLNGNVNERGTLLEIVFSVLIEIVKVCSLACIKELRCIPKGITQ